MRSVADETSYVFNLFQKAFVQKEESAFSEFFDQYYTRLVRYASTFLPSVAAAEDVVSDVLIKLLHDEKLTKSVKNVGAYLYRSIKNEALNVNKSKYNLSKDNAADSLADHVQQDSSDPYQEMVAHELSMLIFHTIEKLPVKRQLAYKFVKDDGLSYAEAAELLEVSERTIESHLKLAMTELRNVVQSWLNNSGNNDSNKRLVKLLLLALAAV